MDWTTQKGKLKDEIKRVICRHLKHSHYMIFFFGSRAGRTADNRSDIDVGIESEGEIPAHIMDLIRTELDELPIMQKIDIVDFNTVSPDFKKVVLETMEIIYER